MKEYEKNMKSMNRSMRILNSYYSKNMKRIFKYI